MTYDKVRIITGSPSEVAKKVESYLNDHPKAQVLGTAITMKRGPAIEPTETKAATPKKPAKKAAANAAADTEEKAAESTTLLAAIEYGPDEPVMAVTVARVFA